LFCGICSFDKPQGFCGQGHFPVPFNFTQSASCQGPTATVPIARGIAQWVWAQLQSPDWHLDSVWQRK
jgi:hypothetical protein